jgi:hypothetical protein
VPDDALVVLWKPRLAVSVFRNCWEFVVCLEMNTWRAVMEGLIVSTH